MGANMHRVSRRLMALYVGAAGAGAIALFVLPNATGALDAPATVAGQPVALAAAPSSAPLVGALLCIVVMLASARGMGALFERLRQPPVIGEIVAGLALGPSLAGLVAPTLSRTLLGPDVLATVGFVGQLGVLLFMFLVGLRLDTDALRARTAHAVAVSHASVLAPFVLGCGLALALYGSYAGAHASFVPFALFLGVAMAVTAFPVLARLLADRGAATTPLGALALSVASVDDVTAWMLLAVVTATVSARFTAAIATLAMFAVYGAVMIGVIRPATTVVMARHAGSARSTLVVALGLMLVSALATELIGVHALFGAFAAGMTVRRASAFAGQIASQIEDLTLSLLVPPYFVMSGIRTNLGALTGHDWLVCAGIIFVASLGKFGGTCLGARLVRLSWPTTAILGVLLNTRGLMELVVLNVGLDLQVISPELFSMMVVMAIVTTIVAAPLVDLIGLERADVDAQRPAKAGAPWKQPSFVVTGNVTE